ncbi:MAG: PepSY-associated TM helix domain-containing protein [Pseudomonadota bacterium]
MKRDRLKRLNHQHTLVGIVLGWLLYLVNFSGTVSVLVDEIKLWEDPALRSAGFANAPLDPIFQQLAADASASEVDIYLPRDGSGVYQVYTTHGFGDEQRHTKSYYNSASSEHVDARGGEGVAQWVEYLHRYLLIMPKDLGRALVGLTGIFMLLLILNGIVIHQRIDRDLYKVRWHRSFHVKWKDLHNATGLWTLPFGIVIAFSGVIVGTVILFALTIAVPVTKGNINEFEEMVEYDAPVPPAYFGAANTLVNADEALRRVEETTGLIPRGLLMNRGNDGGIHLKVLAESTTELVYDAPIWVHPANGEVLNHYNAGVIGSFHDAFATRIFVAMEKLHYAHFGGLAVKLIYLISGLAISLCVVTGMLIYFEKRLRGPSGSLSEKSYHWLSLINAGMLAGLPLAYIVIFFVDRLLVSMPDGRYTIVGATFFGAWAAAVSYCCLVGQARKGARHLMCLTGVLCVALPAFDLVTAPSGFGAAAILAVNLFVFTCGLCVLAYLMASPADVLHARQRGRKTREILGSSRPETSS